MSNQIKQDMQGSAIYDNLITSLITLNVILEDIDKITTEINNKIKQLEAEKTYELDSLEEELRIITLRNRFLLTPNNIEKEIDFREQTKKKIDNIKKLMKKAKEQGFKNAILEDLYYARIDEIDEIEKIELRLKRLGTSKKSINFFKKSIILEEHLRLVLQARKL